MESATTTCECGREFTPAQSSGPTCFKCKAQSIGFNWRGATGIGRKNFHDSTIRGAVEESIRAEKAAGTHGEMDFVGSRWV